MQAAWMGEGGKAEVGGGGGDGGGERVFKNAN